jgi:hypothetical protein
MSLLVNQLGEKLAAMTERAEKAEAQVQRVREVCDIFDKVNMDIPVHAVLECLDGES